MNSREKAQKAQKESKNKEQTARSGKRRTEKPE
jgi:hypothetical protein